MSCVVQSHYSRVPRRIARKINPATSELAPPRLQRYERGPSVTEREGSSSRTKRISREKRKSPFEEQTPSVLSRPRALIRRTDGYLHNLAAPRLVCALQRASGKRHPTISNTRELKSTGGDGKKSATANNIPRGPTPIAKTRHAAHQSGGLVNGHTRYSHVGSPARVTATEDDSDPNFQAYPSPSPRRS